MAYIGNTPESTYSMNVKEYVATEGQTVFPATYGEEVEVYLNGILLASDDYAANDGVQIVLTAGVPAGSIVRVNGYADIITFSGLVTSVAGKTGDVTLTEADITDLDKYTQAEVDTSLALKENIVDNDIKLDLKADKANPIITGSITEEIYTIAGIAPDITPANGTIQSWTLNGISTPTINIDSGQHVNIRIDDGAAFTVNWTDKSIEWKTNGGEAPELNTDSFTWIVIWNIDGSYYGARVGDA